MRVSGKRLHIDPFVTADSGSIEAIDLMYWYSSVKHAAWLGPRDLRAANPKAKRGADGEWRFPLVRSGLTVRARVMFGKPVGLVDIREVSR
jgi:hypothetical protein